MVSHSERKSKVTQEPLADSTAARDKRFRLCSTEITRRDFKNTDIITCLNSALDKTVDFADEKKTIHPSRMGSSFSKAFFRNRGTPPRPPSPLLICDKCHC